MRQGEPIKRPAEIYIAPFNDKIFPAGNITNQSEDHNWRRRKKNINCTEGAIFDRNWPHTGTNGDHYTYINNQRPPSESVDAQISKQTDSHQIVNNMNNSVRDRLQALHLSTWIPIRDELDEEPDRSPQRRPNTIITERPIPDRADANETSNIEAIRQITVAYDVARQAPRIPLPRNASEAQDPLSDDDITQHPTIIEGETLEDIKLTRHPSTRATLRRSSSVSPEDPTGSSQPQTNNHNITGNHDHQNPFSDTLVTEPVLFGDSPEAENNPGTNDKTGGDSQNTCNDREASDNDTTDNTSTTALFAGYGRDEGAGNHSFDSGGSSTGWAARHGRVITRPESFILRGDSYVALTDFRSHRSPWAASANHTCQICKDGSRCLT